jgi:hypothetical protein
MNDVVMRIKHHRRSRGLANLYHLGRTVRALIVFQHEAGPDGGIQSIDHRNQFRRTSRFAAMNFNCCPGGTRLLQIIQHAPVQLKNLDAVPHDGRLIRVQHDVLVGVDDNAKPMRYCSPAFSLDSGADGFQHVGAYIVIGERKQRRQQAVEADIACQTKVHGLAKTGHIFEIQLPQDGLLLGGLKREQARACYRAKSYGFRSRNTDQS